MNQFNLFLELIRFKKPIGYMLLFWPCAWGLSLGYDFNENLSLYLFYLILFFFGSILMRSAGCIINDIADKEFDKKVYRTKNRPIASGKITINLGLIYALTLCIIALLVLINFNKLTIVLALCSMPLAFTYPFMKRFTYWPQLFLGITFNYGLILGWTAINNQVELTPLLLYFGAIFWTLGYDTVYGFQDIKDDEIIGVKSTSIKFKNNAKKFLLFCYSIFFFCYLLVGLLMEFQTAFYIISFSIFIHLFYFQLYKFNCNDGMNCLKIFKSNNFLGFIVLSNIIISKLIF